MILEIAQIEIKPGLEADFEAAIAKASAIFKEAKGCRAFAVERSIEHRSRYRLLKQVVEPVFGQIKAARGFRQLLFRGIERVRHEWALLCTVHNLVKLTS